MRTRSRRWREILEERESVGVAAPLSVSPTGHASLSLGSVWLLLVTQRRVRGRLGLGLGLGEAMRAEREMRAAGEGSGGGCG